MALSFILTPQLLCTWWVGRVHAAYRVPDKLQPDSGLPRNEGFSLATFLNCPQGMAGMSWAGLSTQLIWVDAAGSVVLASVNETRDQRKMGSSRPESQKVGRKKGPSWEYKGSRILELAEL